MERAKARKASASQAQVAVLMDFMKDYSKLRKALDKVELDNKWEDVVKTLNSMGGAVKSADKWRKTWADVKYTTKKRTQLNKHHYNMCDTSMCSNTESRENAHNDSEDGAESPKKRYASFDEEIVKIEREKLDLDREYKVQKIEALSRIASALEEIARKKS